MVYIIIVEGPDGAGKSTLARAIGERFDLEVVSPQRNGSAPVVPVRNRVYRALGKAVQGRHPAKVYDRLYFSELIYGKELRGVVEFSPFEQVYVEDILMGLQPAIFLCLPPMETVLENFRKDPGSQAFVGDEEKLKRIYFAYASRLQQFAPKAALYDYTRDPVESVMFKVEHYLNKRKEREYSAG